MPYPPCTVTASWLKYQDTDRCCRRVTQPPHIAGPLGVIAVPQININLFKISMKDKLIISILISLITCGLFAQSDMVTDVDGNEYKTMKIRDQIWMTENLKTTRFNDGTPIPLVDNILKWQQIQLPAFCWYNNDEKTNKKSMGALYNWYAVETGKLCPIGWHVPSDKVWFEEPTFPSGYRDENGSYIYLKDHSIYWTSTEYTSNEAYYQSVHTIGNKVDRYYTSKKYGHSIRCIKDN
jgi:hypothetical protein